MAGQERGGVLAGAGAPDLLAVSGELGGERAGELGGAGGEQETPAAVASLSISTARTVCHSFDGTCVVRTVSDRVEFVLDACRPQPRRQRAHLVSTGRRRRRARAPRAEARRMTELVPISRRGRRRAGHPAILWASRRRSRARQRLPETGRTHAAVYRTSAPSSARTPPATTSPPKRSAFTAISSICARRSPATVAKRLSALRG